MSLGAPLQPRDLIGLGERTDPCQGFEHDQPVRGDPVVEQEQGHGDDGVEIPAQPPAPSEEPPVREPAPAPVPAGAAFGAVVDASAVCNV